ncbi:hypothetical protein D3C86_1550470 [compost metagenome]
MPSQFCAPFFANRKLIGRHHKPIPFGIIQFFCIDITFESVVHQLCIKLKCPPFCNFRRTVKSKSVRNLPVKIPRSAVVDAVSLLVGFGNQIVDIAVIEAQSVILFESIIQIRIIRKSRLQKRIPTVESIVIHRIGERIHILVIRSVNPSSKRQSYDVILQRICTILDKKRRKKTHISFGKRRILHHGISFLITFDVRIFHPQTKLN